MDVRRLREETRPDHEATEAAMPLTEPGLTMETYQAVLRLLLPVLKSWEDWAAASAPASIRPMLAARRRSPWIEEDLRSLGGSELRSTETELLPIHWPAVVFGSSASQPEHAEPAHAEPGHAETGHAEATDAQPTHQDAAFLGAFYVLEGSTLGGRFIAQHVETTLGISPGQGDAYFRGHGEHTGAMWREVTEAIARLPEQDAEITIAAAKRTFQAFGAVLGTLPQRRLAVHG
ncbi:MAG: biliverdin-producing heme oxygenase [Janthinobacterium lividum]